MFRKIKFLFIYFLLVLIGYSQLCPENCQYNENSSSCYCFSNVTGWYPIYDFVIVNYSIYNFTQENISLKIIYYNFTDHFNYVGNITNCLYLNDKIIQLEKIYLDGSKNYTGNFTIDFCVSPDNRLKIVINCDYSINEVNYSNNNVSFYDDLLGCPDNFEVFGSFETPESENYVFFVLIFIIYYLFKKNEN